jgi:hypothetical protein
MTLYKDLTPNRSSSRSVQKSIYVRPPIGDQTLVPEKL